MYSQCEQALTAEQLSSVSSQIYTWFHDSLEGFNVLTMSTGVSSGTTLFSVFTILHPVSWYTSHCHFLPIKAEPFWLSLKPVWMATQSTQCKIIPSSKFTADNAGDLELPSHCRAVASASAALTAPSTCPSSPYPLPESSLPPQGDCTDTGNMSSLAGTHLTHLRLDAWQNGLLTQSSAKFIRNYLPAVTAIYVTPAGSCTKWLIWN